MQFWAAGSDPSLDYTVPLANGLVPGGNAAALPGHPNNLSFIPTTFGNSVMVVTRRPASRVIRG